MILLLKLLDQGSLSAKNDKDSLRAPLLVQGNRVLSLVLKFFVFYSFCQWDHSAPSCKLFSPWRRGLFPGSLCPPVSSNCPDHTSPPQAPMPMSSGDLAVNRHLPPKCSFPQKCHHTSPHMWVTEKLSNKVMQFFNHRDLCTPPRAGSQSPGRQLDLSVPRVWDPTVMIPVKPTPRPAREAAPH